MTAVDFLVLLHGQKFFHTLGVVLVFPLPEGVLSIAGRLAIALVLSLCSFDPSLPESLHAVSPLGMATDFTLGLMTGVPILILYHAVRMWGDLFESLRGQQLGLIVDPLSGGEEMPLAVLLSQSALVVIVSQSTLPMLFAVAVNRTAGAQGDSVFAAATVLLERILMMAHASMALLMPFLVLVVTVELLVGWISRAGGGISLSSEAYLIRMVLTLIYLVFDSERLIGQFMALPGAGLPG